MVSLASRAAASRLDAGINLKIDRPARDHVRSLASAMYARRKKAMMEEYFLS
jgi:hypothetical protein